MEKNLVHLEYGKKVKNIQEQPCQEVFWDFIATTLGVIPVPKFIEEKIDSDTKFIVIAFDGVWEFLDN